MSIRTVYANGSFDVYDDERHIIHQPFRINDTGIQEPWANEAEAMIWWETQKASYGVVDATPEENTEEK